jgi:hypothetical protein
MAVQSIRTRVGGGICDMADGNAARSCGRGSMAGRKVVTGMLKAAAGQYVSMAGQCYSAYSASHYRDHHLASLLNRRHQCFYGARCTNSALGQPGSSCTLRP